MNGNVCPACRQQRRGQNVPPAPTIAQLPLPQNNPMPNWHILGWHIPSLSLAFH